MSTTIHGLTAYYAVRKFLTLAAISDKASIRCFTRLLCLALNNMLYTLAYSLVALHIYVHIPIYI